MARLNDAKLQELLTLVNELKTDLNNLRADFRAHDHGATYTAEAHRINASANTPSGTEASTAVSAASLPSNVDELYV